MRYLNAYEIPPPPHIISSVENGLGLKYPLHPEMILLPMEKTQIYLEAYLVDCKMGILIDNSCWRIARMNLFWAGIRQCAIFQYVFGTCEGNGTALKLHEMVRIYSF